VWLSFSTLDFPIGKAIQLIAQKEGLQSNNSHGVTGHIMARGEIELSTTSASTTSNGIEVSYGHQAYPRLWDQR
jgi:hypothetical protein